MSSRIATSRWGSGVVLLAIATLGLGIAGATTMYSFVSAVLLAPLPHDDPDTLVVITRNNRQQNFSGLMVPARDALAFREQAGSFSRLSGYTPERVTLTGDAEPENVRAARILPEFLDLLGVVPSLGRNFSMEEHETSAPVVILGHGLWQRRFGGRDDVIGDTLWVDGEDHTVVGVLPAGTEIVAPGLDLMRPWSEADLRSDSRSFVWVIARLGPGVSVLAADEEVDAILRRWEEENRPPVMGWRADVEPIREHIVGEVRTPLWVLFGAVGMLLLIACSNVANLLLARGAEREKELAIRAALGASRLRVVRQLLWESVSLSLAGGILGVVLAYFGTKALVVWASFDVPRLDAVSVDAPVLAFSALLSIGTGVLAGLVPALTSSRVDLDRALKATGHAVGPARHRRRFRSLLTVVQLALALSLSVGAGLMARSFVRLVSVDPGFDTARVLTFQLSLPEYRLGEASVWDATAEEVLERIGALPGVGAVALSSWTPLSGGWGKAQMSVEATSGAIVEREQWPMVLGVTPGYFRTLGLPLARGRDLTLEDGGREDGVVLVNRRMAEQAWPGDDPLGQRLKFGGAASTNPWLTVVGVIEDARLVGLAVENQEGMFRPLLRTGRTLSAVQVLVRTSLGLDPEELMPPIRDAVWGVDDQLPISDVRTMEDLVYNNVSQPRFQLVVIAVFAAIALSLAGIGTYGLLSHAVTERSHEIGLRMALGADRSTVLRLVLRQGMILLGVGLVFGLAIALVLTRLLASLLYEVTTTEPVSFVGAATILAGIGLSATLGPALRATRVDPMTTLRAE